MRIYGQPVEMGQEPADYRRIAGECEMVHPGPGAASAGGRTPVVLFPGYGGNRVAVRVQNQVAAALV